MGFECLNDTSTPSAPSFSSLCLELGLDQIKHTILYIRQPDLHIIVQQAHLIIQLEENTAYFVAKFILICLYALCIFFDALCIVFDTQLV